MTRAPSRLLTPSERDRAIALRAEGMPASWISEDFGLYYDAISRSGVMADPEAVTEWRRMWALIRRDPRLLALHDEIEPPRRFRCNALAGRS